MARPPLPDLRGIRIFSAAAESTLKLLSAQTHARIVQPGEVLLRARNATLAEVLLVFSGVGRYSRMSPRGREVGLQWVIPGSVIGDYAAIDGRPFATDAVAMNIMEIGVLSAEAFRSALTQDPAVARAQMLEMSTGLRRYINRAYELACFDARTRLYRELLRLAEPAANNTAVIRRRLRHEDWATMIGAQRHVVTQILGDLERRAIYRAGSGEAVIQNMDHLRTLIGESEQGVKAIKLRLRGAPVTAHSVTSGAAMQAGTATQAAE